MTTRSRSQTWTAEGAEKRAAVQRMFADIAPTYDRCNSLMCLSLHHRWRALAVTKLNLNAGAKVADVCCGTGDFMPPLRAAVGDKGTILGLDFCLPMLELARAKDAVAGRAVGDACQLPLQTGSVDAVTVGWGIRNVPDIDAAHREILRVLKSGGRFASVDMAVPRNALVRGVAQFMTLKMLPRLGAIFGKKEAYTYLPKSTQTFLSREGLKESMEKAGFQSVEFRDLFFGNICLHWGTKP